MTYLYSNGFLKNCHHCRLKLKENYKWSDDKDHVYCIACWDDIQHDNIEGLRHSAGRYGKGE